MGFLSQIKDSFSSQPLDYQEPTRVQKLQAAYEQKLTPRTRKICKVAFPIAIVVISIGAGVTAAYLAPEGWDKTLGTMIMLNVGGVAMGGYQFAVWRWGKSYNEQMLKIGESEKDHEQRREDYARVRDPQYVQELPEVLKADKERWEAKLAWFQNHQQYFRDFDIANYSSMTFTPDDRPARLHKVAQLLENCVQARTVTLSTEFNKEVLGKIKEIKHLKRLTLDFSKSNGEEIELLQSMLETNADGDFVPNTSIRHLNLNMNPNENEKAGENIKDIDHVILSAEFFENVVKYFPNLKTLNTTHMDPKAWKHLKDLQRIKEIVVEVDSLGKYDEEDARNMQAFRNAVLDHKVQFKAVKIIHPTWKPPTNYRDFDIFQENVRRIIENEAHVTTDDQDGQDNKRTMVLYFSKTMKERWRAIKQRFQRDNNRLPVVS